jgi:hypothetical protein
MPLAPVLREPLAGSTLCSELHAVAEHAVRSGLSSDGLCRNEGRAQAAPAFDTATRNSEVPPGHESRPVTESGSAPARRQSRVSRRRRQSGPLTGSARGLLRGGCRSRRSACRRPIRGLLQALPPVAHVAEQPPARRPSRCWKGRIAEARRYGRRSATRPPKQPSAGRPADWCSRRQPVTPDWSTASWSAPRSITEINVTHRVRYRPHDRGPSGSHVVAALVRERWSQGWRRRRRMWVERRAARPRSCGSPDCRFRGQGACR